MSFDYLSEPARAALIAAQRLARARDEESVEPEHLLWALSDTAEGGALLRLAGAEPAELRLRLRKVMPVQAKTPGAKVYLAERTLKLLEEAQALARRQGAGSVEPAHLLGSFAAEPRGAAAAVLRELAVRLASSAPAPDANAADAKPAPDAKPANPAGASPPPSQASATPLLEKFARDLTALAAAGRLSPVVGRHEETRRLLQILGRSTKNSPVLLGDPGVGKRSLVEGLAQRIAAGDVPAGLARKRIFAFDVGALVAGARFRGEFEERLRGVLDEVRDAAGTIIVFFDDLQTLIGAGRGDGSLDAAALIKPALARGELSCIGATTVEAYRQHIEPDPGFERRFQPVRVEEPTDDACLSMLRAHKPRLSEAHKVCIEDTALSAAVAMARRYVPGRVLPDKALDLLDEACSRLRLELDSQPDEVDAVARRERTLRVEREALGRERGPDAPTRLARVEHDLAEASARLGQLTAQWQAELSAINAVRERRTALERLHSEATTAERAGDLGRAAELRYGQVPQLERALADGEAALAEVQRGERLLEASIEPVHVARVVADWTGIPVTRMLEGEKEKLRGIEAKLRERVVGQDDAIARLSRAIRRSRAGLADPGRPIGSFLFLGPTGVGKTELCKALAEFLFDDEHALIRLDMSEYMEKHTVARLVGSPPGYVGYDEGGQLTEAVRRRPYAVVLFDEVEKAHPDVFNVLLALLDDGRLTDSKGRTVSFTNVVPVMTSNLGSAAILEAAGAGDRAAVVAQVERALRGHFRPEFLNRIDETVIFNPLGRDQLGTIVDLQVKRVGALLAEQKLTLELTPEARAVLVAESYDPAFGARPVKRTVQRRLRDPLAEAVLAGHFPPGSTIRVSRPDPAGSELVLSRADAAGVTSEPAALPPAAPAT